MGMTIDNLCNSCTNIGCEFQSGIVRKKCAFYMPPQLEPDTCGNYVVQDTTTKNNLGFDCISRADAQTKIEMNASRYTIAKERGGMGQIEWSDQLIKVSDAVDIIRHLPPVTPKEPRWIPLTKRPMTDEEQEYYKKWSDVEGAMILDCPLPEDGQEVLVSYGGYVCVDTFCKDDGCYFEGVDIDDVTAWMPLPKPYEPQESEET